MSLPPAQLLCTPMSRTFSRMSTRERTGAQRKIPSTPPDHRPRPPILASRPLRRGGLKPSLPCRHRGQRRREVFFCLMHKSQPTHPTQDYVLRQTDKLSFFHGRPGTLFQTKRKWTDRPRPTLVTLPVLYALAKGPLPYLLISPPLLLPLFECPVGLPPPPPFYIPPPLPIALSPPQAPPPRFLPHCKTPFPLPIPPEFGRNRLWGENRGVFRTVGGSIVRNKRAEKC